MTQRNVLYRSLQMIVVVIGLLLFIFPFVLLLISVFKSNSEITSNPLALPTTYNFDNFTNAFIKMNYLSGFINSLLITLFSVILIAIFAAMTAHYLVRYKSKTNQYLFFLMVASMIIPFQALMIPLVKIYGTLNLLDNKWSLIYMYVGFGVSLAMFIYHGFIKSIPLELEEAAHMDGCTPLQTFFKIVLPILIPTSVTISILNVLWIWNDFLLPSLVLISPEQKTLPLSTYSFYGTYTADYGPLMAGLLLTMLPVLIVYLFAQRVIIQGVMQGAIK